MKRFAFALFVVACPSEPTPAPQSRTGDPWRFYARVAVIGPQALIECVRPDGSSEMTEVMGVDGGIAIVPAAPDAQCSEIRR